MGTTSAEPTLPNEEPSRRDLLIVSATACVSAPMPRLSGCSSVQRTRAPNQSTTKGGDSHMKTTTVNGGAEIYYKDRGNGQPVVFRHGWPLSADAFEDQMFFLASRGHRCIAHDRSGHARYSPPWNGNNMDAYRAEDQRIMLVYGPDALKVSPRIGDTCASPSMICPGIGLMPAANAQHQRTFGRAFQAYDRTGNSNPQGHRQQDHQL